MDEFVIITVPGCPWCEKAVSLVRSKQYPLEVKKMAWGKELREVQSKHEGWKTVPMVYRDGEFIGGYTDLVEYFKNDRQEKAKEPEGPSSETEKSD